MEMYCIGFAGKAGAGKTTLARGVRDFLRDLDIPNTIISFADPVKDIARLMGWDGEKDDKGRRLLQLIGTECGRECIHPDLWCHKWNDSYLRWRDYHPSGVAITDDVRFPNEVNSINRVGGIVVLVENDWATPVRGGIDNHASEAGAFRNGSPPGLVVQNRRGVVDLVVKEVIEQWIKK